MSFPIPRFQGNAIETDGGWTFEFFVSMLGEEEGQLFQCKKIFTTKEEAIKELKIAIKDAIKDLSAKLPQLGIKDNEYIDMKTNSTRLWDKKDEH